MIMRLGLLVGAISALALLSLGPGSVAVARACEVGTWLRPGAAQPSDHAAIVADAASAPAVLLGETHDVPEHHQWQLSVVAALLGQRSDLVLGFEAFPRAVQPVLDRWVSGELGEAQFLREVDWWNVWGFDPELYMPLLRFARLHRIPVVALNVDRALVARVGDEGWDAIPVAERLGIGTPVAPSDAYVDVLAQSYLAHARPAESDGAPGHEEVREQPGFQRFVQAQLTWDRAMAEAVVDGRARSGSPLVVGIIGSGHLTRRHGVPHQLADLGLDDAVVLLPHDGAVGCEALAPDLADAVFVLDQADPAQGSGPRLGVALSSSEGRLAVREVLAGSVAEAAGLQAGDVIVRAAGHPMDVVPDLVAIVKEQPRGTWLPLDVRRGDRELQLVAKFPHADDAAS